MVTVGVHEAKTTLSKLLQRVQAGEEVTITRSGEPIAKLVPASRRGPRKLGLDAGKVWMSPDFDDEMSEEELALWYDAPLVSRASDWAPETP